MRCTSNRQSKENIMNIENTQPEQILAELVAAVEERICYSSRSARLQDALDTARRLVENGAKAPAGVN